MGLLGKKRGALSMAFQVKKPKRILSINAEIISYHLMRCTAKNNFLDLVYKNAQPCYVRCSTKSQNYLLKNHNFLDDETNT